MADQPANTWRTMSRRRLAIAASIAMFWSAAIEARLVYLQVVRHPDLAARAERQQMRTVEAPAKRGDILDRNGRVLAYSVDADTIYAVPTDIGDPIKAAASLCGALEDCSSRDRQALTDRIRKGRFFAYVRRQASPDQVRRIAALQLDGVGFMKENQRFYPNRELAAHLLGYVGIDNEGLGGIEATYDSLIKGREGTVLIQTDARRHAFSRIERPPTTGATLELTIDEYLQHVVERELSNGVQWSGGSSGSAVVMDPFTGEILALASYPTFNLNAYRDVREPAARNRAIQDLFEPGSTFKIVTAGAALEEKVATPTDLIDVSAGQIRFGRRVIYDDHRYGVLSFEEVIVKSSNAGAIKIGLTLGPARLSAYAQRFGFGRPSSPDFRGENAGIVWDGSKLSDSALASVSMGYQVGVTPLQMAAAVSAVANGGELIQPRAVRAVIREGQRVPVPRKVVHRAISPTTAAQLTTIMEGVVERGTGTRAQIPGFTVAGKTGTAKKLINGSYRGHSDYNVSFVGFVPSRKPIFTLIVVVDSPHAVSPYGGVVAAPIFQRIAEAALRSYAAPPSVNAPPPVLVARRDETHEQTTAGPADTPALVALPAPSRSSDGMFPDLTGMDARDALRILARLGLTARLEGTGFVVDQQPSAGAPVDATLVAATLWLNRRAPGPHAGTRQP